MPHAVFQPRCLPLLIGSLPLADHGQAADWVSAATPESPTWAQLPSYPEEGMLRQFASGLPGLAVSDERVFVDTTAAGFETALVDFYEDYLAVAEGAGDLSATRFALQPTTARGFFVLLERLARRPAPPAVVKGQITGPVTFGLGLRQGDGRAIFYDPHLRDAAVKLLALKARWQVRHLKACGAPVVLFLDEPALAGYGSSEMISIAPGEIDVCLGEVSAAVHAEGGLTGIHVCANTDWALILNSAVDIVNFDAYTYLDRFLLYSRELKGFLESGRWVAWGLVPTTPVEAVQGVSLEELRSRWEALLEALARQGMDLERVRRQAFITPSCGAGSLSRPDAERVLALTRDLAAALAF
jgi:methionine synthase II (cobalamin-independent)